MSEDKIVTIGVMYDGFGIVINEKSYNIDQEDDPSIKLKELFESLGFEVKVEEWY